MLVLNWRDPWHPEGGGSELYVQQIATRLVAMGHRVTFFSAAYDGAPPVEEHHGVRYVRRGGHLTVYLWAAFYVLLGRLDLGRLGHFDRVLEVQNGMPFLARLFTRARVVVLVHHVHREQWPVVGPLLARIGWFMESVLALRVNRGAPYVAVSEVTRSELVALGVEPRTISIAYNGAPPLPNFSRQARSEHPSLVVLSRLVPHKQIEHAIEVVHQLRTELPGLHLTIIGSGWWAEHLHSRCRALDLGEQVRFLGHVDDQRKFEELSRAWVHILPSLKEGWGLSIIEAAQVGVPSVAYRSAGGVQESILEGVTGLLADDFDDLTDSARRLLIDAPLRERLGDKAQARAEQLGWSEAATTVRAALGR